MKRYLGIICLLYSTIFSYVVIFDKLKLFLAPQMQIYIKLSIIPFLLIGLVLLFNDKINYKFKVSDLILLLPLISLFISGDGRLTASFASKRTTNYKVEDKVKADNEDDDSKENESSIKKDDNNILTQESDYDFSNPYFEIIDENYNELSGYLTFAPKAERYIGKTIKVKGFALTSASYLPSGYFAIGKYVISCCAADAEYAGFMVKYDKENIVPDGWYEVEGVLEKGIDAEGYDTMYIKAINIKKINSKNEEQYVYPCYTYDDGLCSALSKYDLEY